MNVKTVTRLCLLNHKYATLEDKVHKYSCKEYNEEKELKHRAADFCCMCSNQLALVLITLLQTDEAYSYLQLTTVKYNNKEHSVEEEE